MKVELSGRISQVRGELERLRFQASRSSGLRNLARIGSLACLLAAYAWGALNLPGLIPARVGLAVLLAACTVAVIRRTPEPPDGCKIELLSRLLHILREKAGAQEVTLLAEVAPGDNDCWFTLALPVRALELRLSAGRQSFPAAGAKRRVLGDELVLQLRGPEPIVQTVARAVHDSGLPAVTSCDLESGVLTTRLREAPREASDPSALTEWVTWYLEILGRTAAV